MRDGTSWEQAHPRPLSLWRAFGSRKPRRKEGEETYRVGGGTYRRGEINVGASPRGAWGGKGRPRAAIGGRPPMPKPFPRPNPVIPDRSETPRMIPIADGASLAARGIPGPSQGRHSSHGGCPGGFHSRRMRRIRRTRAAGIEPSGGGGGSPAACRSGAGSPSAP